MSDYTIQSGDNLSKIAKANGTDVNTLLKLNPELKKHPNFIMTGDTLKLPNAPKGAEDVDMHVTGLGIEHNDTETQAAPAPKQQASTGELILTSALVGAGAQVGWNVSKKIPSAAKTVAKATAKTAKAGAAKTTALKRLGHIKKIKVANKVSALKRLAHIKGLKIAGQATAKKAIAKTVARNALVKAVAKKAAVKTVAKAAGKTILKKIPLVGLAVGIGFAIGRLTAGDYTGAALEVASGAVSCVPGVGTAASVAIDVGLAAKDIYNENKKK